MLTCSVHPLPYRANPADYFAAIRHAPGAVLLDSGRPSADRGRYDLLSAWPLEQLAVLPDESGERFPATPARQSDIDSAKLICQRVSTCPSPAV